jgi:hypothetical protein
MSKFIKEKRVASLVKLGDWLLNPDASLNTIILQARNKNAWFTEEQVKNAIKANGTMLNSEDLETWLANYNFSDSQKKIGLVLAGNIPLVGFHDILSVLLAGHVAKIKLSSNDDLLITTILNKLIEIDPDFKDQIQFVNKLEDFDAVIATGSDNTSRYFEYYFSKVPNIIRKNRNSIALLSGKETKEELHALGKDIFDYFGLGCRNVSKLLVPKDYDFIPFFEAIEPYHPIINHHKYNNNYDYNKSIYLVNKVKHLDNGFLLVTENEQYTSPLSVLFYEEYDTLENAIALLNNKKDQIQVVVTHLTEELNTAKANFGGSQLPKLWDYADGVDTMKFLSALA